MDFAERLIQFRAKNNLTQKQAAEILSVNISMIYFYESGKNKPSKKNKIIIDEKMKNYERRADNV
nr:MAG TPA: hypothetical protein [Caudoviricetes sp.]